MKSRMVRNARDLNRLDRSAQSDRSSCRMMRCNSGVSPNCPSVFDIIGGAGVFEGVGPDTFAIGDRFLISGTADPPAPGVVNWIPLSVSTVWIL